MKDILEKVNRNDGMTVPDGYFDDFATRMAASLPPMDWEKDTRDSCYVQEHLAKGASVCLSCGYVYGGMVHDEDV